MTTALSRMDGRAVRCGIGAAILVGGLVTMASAETAAPPAPEPGERPPLARGDRLWPTSDDITARVQRAFAFYGDVAIERRDEAASRNGRVRADTVPTPPPPVVRVAPDEVAPPRFAAPPAVAYASPQPDPRSAVDKAMARMIAVPLPRRRPTPPVAIAATPGTTDADMVRVAALDPSQVEPQVSPRAKADTAPIAAEFAVFGEPKHIPKEALPYLPILRREAAANRVPLWLAIGVGWVESRYNPKLRGTHGVVGLMQVMPSTARFQGYKGSTDQLFEAETNIVWGMRELGWGYAKAGGDACLAVAKYKGGILTKTISSGAASYCQAAKRVTGML